MPAVPETKTAWTNNVDALSSTNLNAYIRDPIRFLMKPPIAKLRHIVTQSLTNGTAVPITFTSEIVDTDIDGIGGHSTSTNTSRYTARYPGWYEISGGVSFASSGTGIRLASWAVNGSNIPGSDALIPTAGSGNSTRLPTRTELVYLDIGDYVELKALQTSGGALNTAVTNDEQATMNVTWRSL